MASWMSAMLEKAKQVATSAKDGVSARLFGEDEARSKNTDRKDVDHGDNNTPTTWTMPTMIMEKTKQMGTSVKNWATWTGSDPELKENTDRKDVDHESKDNNTPPTWTMPTMVMGMGTSVKNWATGTGSGQESKEYTGRKDIDHGPKDNKFTSAWMMSIMEKTKQMGPSVKNRPTGTNNPALKENTAEHTGDQPPGDSSSNAVEVAKTCAPYVAGAACAVAAAPLLISLAGFTSFGIAGGSLVAYFQSVGVVGMGLGGKAAVAAAGAGAVGAYKYLSKEPENPESKKD